MEIARLIAGIFLFVTGLIFTIFPYQTAWFQEQIDAIGSTRRAKDVEPADWNVQLTRVFGFVLVLLGASLIFIGVLN